MSTDNYEPKEQTPEQQAKIEKELDSMVTNWDERVETFDAMGLREELLRGIYSYGYERPSVVQQKCIMPLIRYVTQTILNKPSIEPAKREFEPFFGFATLSRPDLEPLPVPEMYCFGQ